MVMQKKYVSREKCNGSGVIVFYEKWLNPYFVIMKCCVDCMIWFKLIDKCIMSDDKNLYMCAIYIPPDKNIFYRKYECDIFDVLQEEIELYSVDGNVAVIGDLNGRVGKEPDFLRHDNLNRQLNDNIANFIEYVPDDIFCDRLTEDLKHPNCVDLHVSEFVTDDSVNPVVNLHFKIKTDVLLLIICYCPVSHFL